MLLDGKRVIIHGAGGALGGAIARTFAREGAQLFLAGRTRVKLEAVAADVATIGKRAEVDQVDALDADSVDRHADSVAERAGGVDVVLNAISLRDVQGIPLVEMSPEDFTTPIITGVTSQFLTSRAAARHMIRQGAGTIVTLSASPAALPGPLMGGFGVACAATEVFTRHLAGELGPHGVRVVCVRPDKLADAPPELEADFFASLVDKTLLKRLPTLAETADVAAFVASDRASAMTGTVVNMTCGTIAG
ncbi:SDR family NAD(P)-dependent oxidoreductase [Nonomuraea sp. KM90]|uniref:SDR family NAD(P)-dependent oxidoreductase n=1 Tax=Nonomuraea sp. KM90 TaxID=3457428 RepID=UPI003FCC7A58